jgi:BlaI family transcriptional regulator, penicillinase repressor
MKKSPPPPSISGSEWLVASVVWDHDGLTAAEIAERLPATASWKLKTVNTFLARLVAKGVLAVERDGRAFRYRARIPREQCVRAESASFLQRVFGGAVAPMLAHFCDDADLSDADIAELRRILNRKAPSSRQSSPPR